MAPSLKLTILVALLYTKDIHGDGGVTLRISKYAMAGNRLRLTCISEIRPRYNSAEFLVNNITLTNIRQFDDKCFDTVNGKECDPVHCDCSANGNEFYVYYLVDEGIQTNITFSCKMKLTENNIDVDTKSVMVIGSPELSIENNSECNTTMTHTLVCRRSHTVAETGFIKWTHTFKNITIRHVEGITNNGMSLLVIPYCSYQDRGRYTCTAWYDIGDGKQYIQTTTDIGINGSPVFLNKSSHREGTQLYLNAVFVPLAITTNIYWLENKVKIENSSIFHIDSQSILYNISMYNKNIEENAIISELRVKDYQGNTDFKVCAQTRRGVSCLDFLKKQGTRNTQSLHIYYLAMIGGLVIVVSIGSGTLIFLKTRRTSSKKVNIKDSCHPPNARPRSEMCPEDMENPQYSPIAEYEQDVHRYDKTRVPLNMEMKIENQVNEQPHVYFEVQENDVFEEKDDDDGYEHVE